MNNNVTETYKRKIMEISVGENGEIIIKKAFNGITLETSDNENLSICMRDSGFEFIYQGRKYSAKKGLIKQHSKNGVNGFIFENQACNKELRNVDLTTRTYNCMMNAGINTVGELAETPKKDIIRFRNAGRGVLKELEELLIDLKVDWLE